MKYLTMLKTIQARKLSGDKSDKTIADLEQKKSETPQLRGDESAKTMPGSLPYIPGCPPCSGTNWGETRTLPDGVEARGGLDYAVSFPRANSGSQCPECGGSHLVNDQLGTYCTDCKRRPGERKPTDPVLGPKYIGVKWGSEKGYLQVTNPVTSETCEIVAKGGPKWLFDRLKSE